MRRIAIILAVLSCGRQIHSQSPSSAIEGDSITSVVLVLNLAWRIEFKPDGSVHAQYGSLPDDEADLPPSTIDFKSLVRCTRSLRAKAGQKGRSQAFVFDGAEASRTAFYLRDDTLYAYLLSSFVAKWKPRCSADRFELLTESHPLSLPVPDEG